MTGHGAVGVPPVERPPAQALAEVVVDELIRGGVSEAVLCPGSRNAPLSYALQAADAAGRLRLHVRIDERTAGFLALGLSRGSGRPVPVCCTSGTAVANLHPALVEACESGVGVLALTADRPAHLRGTGANQTIDQVGIFGSAVVMAHDLPAPASASTADNAAWRSLVCRALDAAADGPVHLNIQLADPLTPVLPPGPLPPALSGRPHGAAWTVSAAAPFQSWTRSWGPPGLAAAVGMPTAGRLSRTLVVLGAGAPDDAAIWATAAGYPLIAEPTAWPVDAPAVLRAGSLLLGCPELLAQAEPNRVVVMGRPTLGRALGALMRRPGVRVSAVSGAGGGWVDPDHVADEHCGQVGDVQPVQVDPTWAPRWQSADAVAADRRDAETAIGLQGAALARLVRDAAATDVDDKQIGLLVVASSQAVRDLDTAGPPAGNLRVLANRGAAGIDGTLSTAVGAALADQAAGGRRAFALVGDLAFVHDLNGLVIGPEPRPDLTIVVADDDGGAIFSTLEYGEPGRTGSVDEAAAFERVFGTPTGVDIAALCAGVGVPCVSAADRASVEEALTDASPGLRVVHVRTDRTRRRERDAQLRAAVHEAVAQAVADGTPAPDA